MEQPRTTPPDDDRRESAWGERRHHAAGSESPTARGESPTAGGEPPPDDYDLYAGAGAGAGEDWSARYGAAQPPPRGGGLDFSALFVLLDALRRAAPAELQDRFTSLIREALLTLRSLIDWYLERLDRTPAETRIEDIPID